MAADVGGPLIARWRRSEESMTLGFAALVIIALCALPFAALLADLTAVGATVFEVWARPRPWMLLLRSVLLSATVTLIAMGVGTVMGVLIARSSLPARRTLWLIHLFPVLLPPFFLALGWFDLAKITSADGYLS